MKQKLFLECYAGISGDMTVAALLDLGADAEKLMAALKSLNLDGYMVEIRRVKKSGLDVCDFAVIPDDAHASHDHDMAYLHGTPNAQTTVQGPVPGHQPADGPIQDHTNTHTHTQDHDFVHGQEYVVHDHAHEQDHDGHAHAHAHVHRGLPEIKRIIAGSAMTDRAKSTALRIFGILAEAEAEAHGVPADEVHFHEVGAVDSIVDIAAVAICLDDLDIEDVIVSALFEGCGTIRCQHGILPIPVPATLNIVRDYHLPFHQTETFGEFVTPTGAAIAAALRTEEKLPDRYRVEKTGLGGGKREYERPSILRAMLITPLPAKETDGVWKLECNLDDLSGKALGYTMERLFAAGARDVYFTPIYMKKNRPGTLLTVLCAPDERERMEEILFTETTTIGIRRQWMERTVLPREERTVGISFGEVEAKAVIRDGREDLLPEYESVAAIAREKALPFQETERRIAEELRDK